MRALPNLSGSASASIPGSAALAREFWEAVGPALKRHVDRGELDATVKEGLGVFKAGDAVGAIHR